MAARSGAGMKEAANGRRDHVAGMMSDDRYPSNL
jgi:hypothetical protein